MTFNQRKKRGKRGFKSASSLLRVHIQKASETRGFAVSKLLTNWSEIIGDDIAEMAKPVKVNYGREGLGAGLVLLTNGANAPIVQAQSKQIIDRVNSVYGYNAISRVRITQIDPNELIDEKNNDSVQLVQPSELDKKKANGEVTGIKDNNLNDALRSLGANIIAKVPN